MSSSRRQAGQPGFTLIDLVVVVSIISLLAAIALPNYRVAIIQSKEAVLKENLFRMRDLIDQYYADKGKYPATLEALVEDGYLRVLPPDPNTRQADWVVVEAEPEPDPPSVGAKGLVLEAEAMQTSGDVSVVTTEGGGRAVAPGAGGGGLLGAFRASRRADYVLGFRTGPAARGFRFRIDDGEFIAVDAPKEGATEIVPRLPLDGGRPLDGRRGNGIGQAPLHTLIDRVAGRVDQIVEKFQVENIPCVGDGEIFLDTLLSL